MTDPAHKATFRRNVRWQLIGSVSQALLSGLLLMLMGRKLGTEGFGIFSIVMGFVYVANLLFEPRIQDVAAKQFWDFNRDDSSGRHNSHFVDLFAVEAVGKLLPCIALTLLASLLASVGNLPPGASVLIVIAAVGVYLSKLGNGLSVGLLRVLGRSDLYAYCATGELSLRLLLTLALVVFSDLTVLGCVVVLCISGIVSNFIQLALTAKHFEGIGAALQDWTLAVALKRLRENRRLLLSNMGLSASDLMNKDLDITLLSPLLAYDQIGIYKMAKNITLLTWRAVDPVYLALMPEMSRLVAIGNFAGVKRLLVKTSICLLVGAAGLSLVSYLLLVFFGDSVLGAGFSSIPELIPLMLIGIVFSAPLVWGHPLAVALNRADAALAGSFFGSVIGLIAFLVFPPIYGLYGAAGAWTLTFIINFTFTSAVTYHLLRMRARIDNRRIDGQLNPSSSNEGGPST
jgi:O-antigen/teichoic acid export membrane protein